MFLLYILIRGAHLHVIFIHYTHTHVRNCVLTCTYITEKTVSTLAGDLVPYR